MKKAGQIKLDTGIIARRMRSGLKALDQRAIRTSKKEVHVIAATHDTRRAVLLDLKTASPDMVSACEGSSAIPLFCGPVEVNGELYYDGALSELPLKEIIERFKPTHLLIQPNVSLRHFLRSQYPGVGRTMLRTVGRFCAAVLPSKVGDFFVMNENIRKFYNEVEDLRGIKVAILWPPDEGLGRLVNNPSVIRNAILKTYAKTISDFGERAPKNIALYTEIPD